MMSLSRAKHPNHFTCPECQTGYRLDRVDAVEKVPCEPWAFHWLRGCGLISGAPPLAPPPALLILSHSGGRRLQWRSEQAERHGLEVLHDGGEVELVACPGEAA